MIMDIFQSFFPIVWMMTIARAEIFTSVAHLENALYAERDIARTLKNYIQREEEKLEKLKSIADDMETHSANALKDPVRYLANPIGAFLFIKRFTLDWDRDVATILKDDKMHQVLLSEVENSRQSLPNYEDLAGVAAAFMRLQDTYQLDTTRLAEGDIHGRQISALTAEDCFQLGRFAYNARDYYHTYIWMQAALQKEHGEENKTISRFELLDYSAYATAMQGNLRHALSMTNELLIIDPSHERAQNNKRYYEQMIVEEEKKFGNRGDIGETPIKNEPDVDEYRQSAEFRHYEALCRGEEVLEVQDQHRLRCRYYNNNKHPMLLIGPVKEEDVHISPKIVMYYDVLSDSEIEVIKSLAMPKLMRATIQNSKTGELETASYRVSKSAWLMTSDHPMIDKICKRIEAISGLTLDTAEYLQVANYGIGGHYEPHYDFARKEEKDAFKSLGTGNRIATWLNYMTDVELGGATVFPYIGVKVFPKKGAAAFWHNLYRNGEGIYDTRHAACPVLIGTKWVSNKWIHERGQEFRRPCSTNPEE
ncbi:prolyl 4-hydroxylase subunit alpha-1-like isoform X2 [Gigantopelta aegis]|uniref:prolyl 4-hydroxylase subunit alpha-1-like isoform X2 n=1 Tax=Gigantopelta aegis TaxID=1735272 RepID=UPI001B889717|nr:prolyl 4-hydroxylase subunit alpha-1-like isoform X2 [Gigantopelta aegis]